MWPAFQNNIYYTLSSYKNNNADCLGNTEKFKEQNWI